MLVGGGASFAVGGSLVVGGGTLFANLYAFDGGQVTAGSLRLIGFDTVATDAASAIEIGTAGGAVAGALNVDAGATVTASYDSTIDTNLVDNGNVVFTGNFSARFASTIAGTVSGGGTLELANYADVAAAGSVASVADGRLRRHHGHARPDRRRAASRPRSPG